MNLTVKGKQWENERSRLTVELPHGGKARNDFLLLNMVSSVLAGVKARERAVVTTQQQTGEAGGPGYNLPLNGQPHAQTGMATSVLEDLRFGHLLSQMIR